MSISQISDFPFSWSVQGRQMLDDQHPSDAIAMSGAQEYLPDTQSAGRGACLCCRLVNSPAKE
jgi:hypothetical protein